MRHCTKLLVTLVLFPYSFKASTQSASNPWSGLGMLQSAAANSTSPAAPSSSSTVQPSSATSSSAVDQGAAEQAAAEATVGNEGSINFIPDSQAGDADMIAQGLEDSFDDLPEREGQGWMESSEEPGSGSGRFLDFWRLRATDMEGLVTPKGYPVEKHKVLTRDGFLLTNFRIPYGRSGPDGAKKPGAGAERQPVLLIHGISLSSTCWDIQQKWQVLDPIPTDRFMTREVINEREESLAFILADEGYDVWMMNTRGNTFSREHEQYKDSNPRFWRFAVDEMAQADLPATLIYIRKVTNATKVHVVGHSQGGTLGLALLAKKPEAADGIGCLVAIAPVVYAQYLLSPTLVAFSLQANVSIASTLPPQEYLFMSGAMQAVFLSGLCQIPALVPICTASTESMFGGSKYISTVQYQKYWKVWPSPTSYYNALHWGQMFNEPEPRFMEFNYGPEYDLTKIRAPVVLMTGGRDVLSTPEDMSRTQQRLTQGGSLSGVHETEDFGHMDFIWHTGARKTTVPIIVAAMDRYTNEAPNNATTDL